jgi:hypothetical protein
MRCCLRTNIIAAISLTLAGCASPFYVHDPQQAFFTPDQIPWLLKSLRCELATYAAANNQRQIIHSAMLTYRRDRERANSEYPYFALDPSRYGGVALELKIQDSLGLQSGTTFDWKRVERDNVHVRTWHIGPTVSDQSTYDAVLSFTTPQDTYRFNRELVTLQVIEGGNTEPSPTKPFACYNHVPERDPTTILFKPPYYALTIPAPIPGVKYKYAQGFPADINIGDLSQDLDALAAGKYSQYENFQRIRVNAHKPLAQWLMEISTTLSSTSMVQRPEEQEQTINAGQMTYTFTIQTSAALDLKTGWSTTLWTALAGEVAGGFQHTGVLTLVLNGTDSANSAGTKTGSSVRFADNSKRPTEISVSYTPLPAIVAVDISKKSKKFTTPLEEIIKQPRQFVPLTKPKGSLIYPLVPLSPLGQ